MCAASSSSNSISRTAAAALPVIGRLATSASGIGFLLAVRFPQQVAHHQGGAVRGLLHEIADQRCPFGISLGGGNHIERDRQVRVGNGRTLNFLGNLRTNSGLALLDRKSTRLNSSH